MASLNTGNSGDITGFTGYRQLSQIVECLSLGLDGIEHFIEFDTHTACFHNQLFHLCSSWLRSPARALGGDATVVPLPGVAISQRSVMRCWIAPNVKEKS